jgi:hypothetical protein
MFSAIVKQTCRATRSYATQVEHKAIVMDANGVIYRRLRKKLLALEDHLFKLGTYDKEKLISKINVRAQYSYNLSQRYQLIQNSVLKFRNSQSVAIRVARLEFRNY